MASAIHHQENVANKQIHPKGLFVILNLLTTREVGSPEDTKRIDSVFKNLGFQNLHSKNDFSIKDAHEAAETLINHPNKDLPRVFFIMSHGKEGGQLEDFKEHSFHINGIIKRFNVVQHPELENTMKLIFVNACRGPEIPICYDSWNRYKNLAVGYSCRKNMKSPRLPDGSPFIKVLCKEFKKNFKSVPLPKIFDNITTKLTGYKAYGVKYDFIPEFEKVQHFSEVYKEHPVQVAIESLMQAHEDALMAEFDFYYDPPPEDSTFLVLDSDDEISGPNQVYYHDFIEDLENEDEVNSFKRLLPMELSRC